MPRSSPVTVRHAPMPRLHEHKTRLLDEIRDLNWEFTHHPTRALADQMAERYEQVIALDRRIVQSIVFSALIDEAMASA